MKQTFELIPPENYSIQLQERLIQLEKAIRILNNSLENSPKGNIRIAAKGKSLQFYYITQKGDKKGEYLPKSKHPLAQKIIQSRYNHLQLQLLEDEKKAIQKLLNNSHNSAAARKLKKISSYRNMLAIPATLSDMDYAVSWQAVSYSQKAFQPGSPEYFTLNGLRVRSKSEILIAEVLSKSGIPFRYEYPLTLETDYKQVKLHPDFYCLNIRTRKEYIWEHFGMMDDSDYAEKSIQKMNLYLRNNYIPGINLIITQETQSQPLSIKLLQKIIQYYLL